MKLTLYYMTGTGNSLDIARSIAGEFRNSEGIFMPELLRENRKVRIEGDLVGFITPVYFARPPASVKAFIEEADFGDISYLFAVMNGGGLFGRALHLLDGMVQDKGRNLDAGFIIPMPGNHPKVGSMQRKTPEAYYARKNLKVKTITDCIASRESHAVESNLGLLGIIFSRWVFRKTYALSVARELDSALWVNDACLRCGICETVCPMDNISDSATKPRWNHNCINCCACYHHCPEKALCLGKEDPQFRYLHPGLAKGAFPALRTSGAFVSTEEADPL